MKDEKKRVFSIFSSFVLVVLLMSGCVPATSQLRVVQVENAANKGRLSFFLNLLEKDGPDLFMQLSAIELTDENGTIVTHELGSLLLESGSVGDGQKFVSRMAIPPGSYTKMQLIVDEAGQVSEQGNRLIPLKDSKVVMDLRSPLNIRVGDSKSLFFTWDTKQSLVDKQFYPVITVAPSLKKLISAVAYVACPEIDTVFMVSTEKNRVIDSIGIPGGPAYLFRNNDPRSDEVYALASSGLRLYAFSPTTNRLTENYNLTMLNEPVHAAFNKNGRWGYVLDRQLGAVFRMDMTSGTIDKQVRLNYEPAYIIYLEKYDLIAVSLSVAQTVVLLNAESMEQVASIPTGTNPDGLEYVGERLLYIAERGANSVQVYDLDTNSMIKRITVGFQPRRIVQARNFVYVANSGDNSITTMRLGGMAVSRAVSLGGAPLEMTYNEQFSEVYAGNQQTMTLEVINSVTNQIKGSVELGAVPQGILVMYDNIF